MGGFPGKSLEEIQFQAPELHTDGTIRSCSYSISGQPSTGWEILRKNAPHLQLGPGFELVESVVCGVCSTDLARIYLPYPLPQIVGHEVAARHNNKIYAVEINASHHARGLSTDCPYCNNNLSSQCPERITLGIDRLPGGFSPYLLAPKNALVAVPSGLSVDAASLTEPFAAALHAVMFTPPATDERVLVMGPRKLGALLIAALRFYRERNGLNFSITALIRRESRSDLAHAAGADDTILLNSDRPPEKNTFDLVFDTTGSSEGLSMALKLTRRALHLKSTTGQRAAGQDRLTEAVVDEISIVPFSPEAMNFSWPGVNWNNKNILVSPSLPESVLFELKEAFPDQNFHVLSARDAVREIKEHGASYPHGSLLPRYDLAIVTNPTEVDDYIRPDPQHEFSPVRVRGAVLLYPTEKNIEKDDAELFHTIMEKGIGVHTSRCGDFRAALDYMSEFRDRFENLTRKMVTHRFELNQLSDALKIASSPESIKVLVDTAPSD